MLLTEDKLYSVSIERESKDDTALGEGTVELAFSNKELVHSILTCGIPIQRLTYAYPGKRKMEFLNKIFLVETALETEGDRLKKSQQTLYLDSSEKSLISYYMGMFFTKLVSQKLYGTDYLTNLNTIRDSEKEEFMDFFCSKWRPDMIGYQTGNDSWSVWEAKGGSNRRAPALKSGCDHASEIHSLNGKEPYPAAVCMTYYDHSYLNAVVKETGGNEGKDLSFREEEFYRSYYEGIKELFLECGDSLKWKNGEVEIAIEVPYFHHIDRKEEKRILHVGMPEEAFTYLMKEEYHKIKDVDVHQLSAEDRFIGTDRIYIR